MAGQTVLVTGGTGGIGKATATGLAAMGARVGITGRDTARTRVAAAEIAAASGNPAVDPFPADMSSQAEVRRLAGEVLAAYPRLDVLVNSVGGFWATRRLTVDGLERTFAVKHLAPFLLTCLLTGRLTASAPARIVTVSSGAHTGGRLTSVICKESAGTRGGRPTANLNWPTSCSPASWHAASTAPASPPPRCTRAWSVPDSPPRIPRRCGGSSFP